MTLFHLIVKSKAKLSLNLHEREFNCNKYFSFPRDIINAVIKNKVKDRLVKSASLREI